MASTRSCRSLPRCPSLRLASQSDAGSVVRPSGTAGRADFFRGGVTISSLTPLRGIPYRVVCLLGMDESAFALGSPNGDDLTTADPRLGDRDRRSDARQAVLETVLAAREHLVLIRNGRSVVTNQPIPPAVVYRTRWDPHTTAGPAQAPQTGPW